ncbi:chaperone NapD [Rhodoplanes azumiensis]|uniref:Chaperone NapD n=1 Tax=Rhodoplanes azumiensis TaxID=1897628 RepID=A0ABW5AIA8_9BRAD
MTDRGTNVCGVLVHAVPSRADDVAQALRAIPGSELHAVLAGGRLIVTLEDTDRATALSGLETIHRTPGVVAAALVFHGFDPDRSPADPPVMEA